MGLVVGITGLTRPAQQAGYHTGSRHRSVGILLALLGAGLGALGLLISITSAVLIASGGAKDQVETYGLLSFGIAVAGLGTAKTGIAFVLWGIVRRIWLRIESVKRACRALVQVRERTASHAPAPLFIHRMARVMWAPMLVMGVMAVFAGLALAYVGSLSRDPDLTRALRAIVPGLQFLGEGFLLSAIAFFLGTILGAIRAGGGEVQESLAVAVKTLATPTAAKLFVGIMMLGLMIELAQFVAYLYVATRADPGTIATYLAWLGPFREFGLGALLSSIVLALATIATALDFQFSRVRELITTGR